MSQTHSPISIRVAGDIDFSHRLSGKLSSLCAEDKLLRFTITEGRGMRKRLRDKGRECQIERQLDTERERQREEEESTTER